jgi:hypothetical protein
MIPIYIPNPSIWGASFLSDIHTLGGWSPSTLLNPRAKHVGFRVFLPGRSPR